MANGTFRRTSHAIAFGGTLIVAAFVGVPDGHASGAASNHPDANLVAGAALDLIAPMMVEPGAPPPDHEAEIEVAQAMQTVTPQSVGQPPTEDETRPEILGALDVGGVLTPRGMLVVEPSATYSHSGVDRFTFRGTEIVETVLIGVVEAEDADRDFTESALTLRYGVTDRFEIEARIPSIYRDDRITTSTNVGGNSVDIIDSLDGYGLGDVEAAAHYQVNQGGGGVPYFVANLRGKFPTGKGPFDVDRDASGIEEELPTGSGFYSVEPSLTVIYPSDPVVLYANAGYLINFERDIDESVGGSQIDQVDAGNAIRFGFGFSFAANENASFSLGYSQDIIDETVSEINGSQVKAEKLTVGSITMGLSHRINDWMSIDLGTTFGVTGDATDVSLGLRLPMRFQLF